MNNTIGQELSTLLASKSTSDLDILKYIRHQKLRESSLVILHGTNILGSSVESIRSASKKYDDAEFLAIVEQVLIAAIDLHDQTLGERCYEYLKGRFGNKSLRVRRLLGLGLEADGDYEEAEKLYNNLLQENPACSFALKRKYCLLKAQVGREMDAMDALKTYLEKFPSDASAWQQMYEACMDVGDYKSAAFCMEELVLSSPLDAQLHCTLGEVYASISGPGVLDNLRLARKHLAQSLDLDSSTQNIRAFYALIACASSFITELCRSNKKAVEKISKEEELVAMELIKYGSDKLITIYSKSSNKRLENIVIELLKQTLDAAHEIVEEVSK